MASMSGGRGIEIPTDSLFVRELGFEGLLCHGGGAAGVLCRRENSRGVGEDDELAPFWSEVMSRAVVLAKIQ